MITQHCTPFNSKEIKGWLTSEEIVSFRSFFTFFSTDLTSSTSFPAKKKKMSFFLRINVKINITLDSIFYTNQTNSTLKITFFHSTKNKFTRLKMIKLRYINQNPKLTCISKWKSLMWCIKSSFTMKMFHLSNLWSRFINLKLNQKLYWKDKLNYFILSRPNSLDLVMELGSFK